MRLHRKWQYDWAVIKWPLHFIICNSTTRTSIVACRDDSCVANTAMPNRMMNITNSRASVVLGVNSPYLFKTSMFENTESSWIVSTIEGKQQFNENYLYKYCWHGWKHQCASRRSSGVHASTSARNRPRDTYPALTQCINVQFNENHPYPMVARVTIMK